VKAGHSRRYTGERKSPTHEFNGFGKTVLGGPQDSVSKERGVPGVAKIGVRRYTRIQRKETRDSDYVGEGKVTLGGWKAGLGQSRGFLRGGRWCG